MASYTSNRVLAYTVILNVNVSSQNISSNSSNISWSLQFRCDTAGYSLNKAGGDIFYATINGQQVFRANRAVNISGPSTQTIASGSLNVAHNADGTKSISVSFGRTKNGSVGTYDPASMSGSGTFGLPKITRLNSDSYSQGPYRVGDTLDITITKQNDSFTTTLYLDWYNNEYYKPLTANTDGTEKYITEKTFQWTVPEWILRAIPNSSSGWGRIMAHTKDANGTYLGNVNGPRFDVVIDEDSSSKPTIDSVTITEGTDGIASKFGGYVQSLSCLRITATATPKLYSYMTRLEVTVNGRTYSAAYGEMIQTDKIMTSGTVPVKIKVIDSRGFSQETTRNITVIPYFTPNVVMTVYRANTDGTGNEESKNARIAYTINYATVNSKNTVDISIQYTADITNANPTWTTIKTDTKSGAFVTGAIFDQSSPYLIRALVTDKAGSSYTSGTYQIGVSFYLMDFGAGGKSIAVGKKSSNNGKLELAMPTAIEDSLTLSNAAKQAIVDTIYPVHSVVQLKDGADPNTLFGGTWVKHNVCWVAAMAPTKGMVTSWAQYNNDTAVVLYELSTTANDSWQMKLKQNLTTATFVAVNTWLRTA